MFHIPFDFYPLLKPFLFLLDPEKAHNLSLLCLRKGLVPAAKIPNDPILNATFGPLSLPHPIGLGAGFDKQGDLIQELFNFGFSFAEIGGVTPKPQPGNPRPRMFRDVPHKAIINRFNFNSIGFQAFLRHLEAWHDATAMEKERPIVGVNIAHGDNVKDEAEAYIRGIEMFAPYISFATINISCPNAPDARHLEEKDELKALLERVTKAHASLEKKPLLLVKISPDQTEAQAKDIADAVLSVPLDGMIVGNSTTDRPSSLPASFAAEKGGLSGEPLFEKSTKLLGLMYRLTEGKVPLIGCGGVFSGQDAYAKIRAGASLVQIYTSMVFRGPYVVAHILEEMIPLLKRDGFSCIKEAVGADFRKESL
ncbi:MAG: quinone-dependent dihydroorotate dehydrogenase [Alphaproteobacteria bacterium]|nr:quinone-dependent dihydroorotate dehydrogenase [Alphaproteobacteria bacterium]